MDMNVDLLQWFKMFLIKKRQVVPLRKNLWNMKNWLKNFTNQLIEKLRNEIGSSFIDNIQGADLAGMQLINKFSKGLKFLLCVINIDSKQHGLFL